MMDTLEIQDFRKDVLERSRTIPVVADFWAEWCGPCRVLGPVLEGLAKKGEGRWALAKVDTDRHQDVAAEYGIRGIPSVKLFVDGAVVNEFTGALPERMVAEWLEASLPSPVHDQIRQARELIDDGRTGDAVETLEDVLRAFHGNEEASVLLARILLPSNPERSLGLVEGIEQDSAQYQDADAVRTVASLLRKASNPMLLPAGASRESYLAALRSVAEGQYAPAIEQFIAAIREDRAYDDDGARKACVALFRFLGEEHPMTQRYRREFARALNI